MPEASREVVLPEGREVVIPDHDQERHHLLEDLRVVGEVVNRSGAGEPLLQEAGTALRRAGTLTRIAVGLHRHGSFDEVDRLFARAVTVAEEALEPTDPTLAEFLRRRAGFLMREGRAEEAALLYRRALAVLRASLGSSHPDVATTLHDLALACEVVGRTEEAQLLWAEARTAFRDQDARA